MAEAGLVHRVLGRLRENPAAYSAARSLYRGATSAPREILRALAPTDSRFGPPRGVFSAFAGLEAGELEGRVLYRGQETPPTPPDSMIARCGFRQDEYQPWPAFWTHHKEMRLAGTSLLPVDGHKRACVEAMYQSGPGFDRNPGYSYLALPKPVRLPGAWTSLVSVLGHHFYHWFHDELPRLWALQEFPPETGILIPNEPAPWIRETLRSLDLENRVRPSPERHLIVEDFYFSAPTAMLGCPNPHALHFLRERFLPKRGASGAGPRRIYLVRGNKTRGIANAAEVEAFFRARGWAVIDPEKLSLAEQIALFADAEALCGLHGGAFTNLVWCSPGCRVLELFAEGFLNGCYEGIALCLNLPHRWLIFPADGEFRARVDLERVSGALRESSL